MKCPRCKVESVEFRNGRFVPVPVTTCSFCGFIVDGDRNRFINHCAEMIMRNISSFKRTGDVNHVYLADKYFQVLKAEIDEETLPKSAEVSI